MGIRLAIFALLGLTATAHAQSAEAEAMFNEGDKLMAAGKLAEACSAFEASNNMDPRAGTLIRLGECREQNHQIASAWSAYKDALGRVKRIDDGHRGAIVAAAPPGTDWFVAPSARGLVPPWASWRWPPR